MPLLGSTRGSLAWKGAALALVFAALVMSLPDSASAHANLADANPAPNSVLDTSPSRITIWFTEPLEPSFSAIEVLDSQGSRVDNDDSVVDRAQPHGHGTSLVPRTTCRTEPIRSHGETSQPSTVTRFAEHSSIPSANRCRPNRPTFRVSLLSSRPPSRSCDGPSSSADCPCSASSCYGSSSSVLRSCR